MEVNELIRKWKLVPLAGEGGYFRFITEFSSLNAGSIFYLVTKDSFSSLHRLEEDELWFFLEGGSSVQLVFDENTGKSETRILSAQSRVSLVKKGLWQATKLEEGEYALFSTVMCPHYENWMYSSPDEALLKRFPHLREYI